jgi:hypothetical protein
MSDLQLLRDGRRVIFARYKNGTEGAATELWDLETDTKLQSFPGSFRGVSPDEKTLVIGTQHNNTAVWRARP